MDGGLKLRLLSPHCCTRKRKWRAAAFRLQRLKEDGSSFLVAICFNRWLFAEATCKKLNEAKMGKSSAWSPSCSNPSESPAAPSQGAVPRCLCCLPASSYLFLHLDLSDSLRENWTASQNSESHRCSIESRFIHPRPCGEEAGTWETAAIQRGQKKGRKGEAGVPGGREGRCNSS